MDDQKASTVREDAPVLPGARVHVQSPPGRTVRTRQAPAETEAQRPEDTEWYAVLGED